MVKDNKNSFCISATTPIHNSDDSYTKSFESVVIKKLDDIAKASEARHVEIQNTFIQDAETSIQNSINMAEEIKIEESLQEIALRAKLFWIVMGLLIFVTVAGMAIIFIALFWFTRSPGGAISSILGAVTAIVAVAIKLPEIITQHLYPMKEEKNENP